MLRSERAEGCIGGGEQDVGHERLVRRVGRVEPGLLERGLHATGREVPEAGRGVGILGTTRRRVDSHELKRCIHRMQGERQQATMQIGK